MKILWSVPRYVPKVNAGAEWYAHEVNKYLISQGHEVRLLLPHTEPYEIDGVQVDKAHNSHFKWADIVFTQLQEHSDKAIFQAIFHNKPCVFVAHNTFPQMSVRRYKQVGVIYNCEAAMRQMDYGDRPKMVLRPPIDIDYYSGPSGNKYTLINLCDNKGPGTFYKLAEMMPDKEFLGVIGGYHRQVVKQMPNVEIMPHTHDIREAYRKTRILLMPSKYESWGRTATEAMCSGIPVIAHPTFGLEENIGDAGIFCDRSKPEQWAEAIEIIESNYEYWSNKAIERAKYLKPDFTEFDLFLNQMVNHGS